MKFEDIVKENGFIDVSEFNKLVAAVDISTAEKLDAYKHWQNNDCTKVGLLKLPTVS